jgi:hypothetical protein
MMYLITMVLASYMYTPIKPSLGRSKSMLCLCCKVMLAQNTMPSAIILFASAIAATVASFVVLGSAGPGLLLDAADALG